MDVYAAGSTVHIHFTTNAASGAAVAPSTALEAADVVLYKDGSATQRSSTAGWTMTSPFDSTTGLHLISFDLSDNTDSGFYAAGSVYTAVLSPDETVDSQVVVAVIGKFKIGTLDANVTTFGGTAGTFSSGRPEVNTTHAAGTAWGSGAITAAAIADGAIDRATFAADTGLQTVRSNTAQAGTTTTITLDASASATNNIYTGMVIYTTGGTGAGQARTIVSYNGTTKIATVDRAFVTAPGGTTTFAILAVNTPALNGTLQVSATVARVVITSGTAQSGSTSNTIVLSAGSSATNNLLNGTLIALTGGTGAGQTRTIISYNGTTKVATVDKAWVTTPTNTTTYDVYASTTPSVFSDQGVAQAATSSSITLASTASSTNSIYVGSVVTILSGTGSGGTSEITAYNGGTKVATVSPNWAVTPDSTSAYAVIPTNAAGDSSIQNVNVLSIGGTVQTGADVGGIVTSAGNAKADVLYWNGSAVASPDTAGYPKVTIKDGTGTGEIDTSSGKVVTTYALRKNVALTAFPFVMTDALTGAPAPTLTVTAQRSLDGGALSSMANSVVEVGNGIYKINLAQADTNADTIVYRFTATGANDLILSFITQS